MMRLVKLSEKTISLIFVVHLIGWYVALSPYCAPLVMLHVCAVCFYTTFFSVCILKKCFFQNGMETMNHNFHVHEYPVHQDCASAGPHYDPASVSIESSKLLL